VSSYLEIQLAQQPIELCKLLKAANLVGGGGEAKVVISEGYVLLNGEVEFQKRKKIYHNDVVEYNGEVLQVLVNESIAELSEESSQHEQLNQASDISTATSDDNGNDAPANNKKTRARLNNQADNTAKVEQDSQVKTPRKRKPISF